MNIGKGIGMAVLIVVFLAGIIPVAICPPVFENGIVVEYLWAEMDDMSEWEDVEPGKTFYVEFCYELSYSWSPQENVDRVVVGFEDRVLFCVDEEVRLREGTPDTGRTAREIIAPMEPGIYGYYKTYTKGLTCSEAKEHYENNPGAREIIDHFEVRADVPDDPDKPDDSGVDCARDISIKLNGGGDCIITEPGEVIGIEIFYEFLPVFSPRERINEVVIGFEDEPIFCLVGPFLDEPTNIRRFVQADEIIAPSEPGIYHVMMTRIMGYSCEDAKKYYRENPSKREIIGTIEVIGDDPGAWKEIHRHNIGYVSSNYMTVNYCVAFYQRDNNLRIEISTPDYYWLNHGSVSISVEESVDVYYNTGNVWGVLFPSSEYSEITPDIDPDLAWAQRSILLVAGLIPGLGSTLNAIGYLEDITDEENRVHRYAKESKIDDSKYVPKDYFELRKMSNERDIVVIPWYVGIPIHGASAIRINCPDMVFPAHGTYDMAFRIDCLVDGEKVRLDIALPIEIGKQRMEA